MVWLFDIFELLGLSFTLIFNDFFLSTSVRMKPSRLKENLEGYPVKTFRFILFQRPDETFQVGRKP